MKAHETADNAATVECDFPRWERRPARVTFLPKGGEQFTVNIGTRHMEEPVDNAAEP